MKKRKIENIKKELKELERLEFNKKALIAFGENFLHTMNQYKKGTKFYESEIENFCKEMERINVFIYEVNEYEIVLEDYVKINLELNNIEVWDIEEEKWIEF